MSEHPDIRSIEFENAFFAADGDWIESLLVISEREFDPEAALSSLSRLELFFSERVSSDGDDRQTYRLTVVAHEPYPFLLGMILRERAIPNRLVLSSDRFAGVVTVSEWEDFQRVADEMREQYGRFELQSVNQVETTGAPLGSGEIGRVVRNELSQDQLVVLQTAHEMGYFETPRKASADDIASKLDIAQSTLSERLRLAENQLFDLVFSPSDDATTTE